jgi:hypothetical protein
MVMKKEENRSERREFFSVTFEYSYMPVGNGKRRRCISPALTTNMSKKGLGIYTDRGLQEGQDIWVFCKHVRDSVFSAEVKWCRKISDALFRVGLAITETVPECA